MSRCWALALRCGKFVVELLWACPLVVSVAGVRIVEFGSNRMLMNEMNRPIDLQQQSVLRARRDSGTLRLSDFRPLAFFSWVTVQLLQLCVIVECSTFGILASLHWQIIECRWRRQVTEATTDQHSYLSRSGLYDLAVMCRSYRNCSFTTAVNNFTPPALRSYSGHEVLRLVTILKISNGHISETGYPIHFTFGSRVGFWSRRIEWRYFRLDQIQDGAGRHLGKFRMAYLRYEEAWIREQLWRNIRENNARGVLRLVTI